MRCGEIVTYHKRNDFLAHINLSVGSACQNALCSADNATKAETAAVQRLSSLVAMYYHVVFVLNEYQFE